MALKASITTNRVSKPAMATAAAISSACTLIMKASPAMTRRTAMRITVWNALLSKRLDAILFQLLVAMLSNCFTGIKLYTLIVTRRRG